MSSSLSHAYESFFKKRSVSYFTGNLFAAELQTLCTEYFNRMNALESDKYDLEFESRRKDFEVHEICLSLKAPKFPF